MSNILHGHSDVVRRFLVEDQGATASEYAIILGVITVAAVSGAALFGLNFADTTSSVFSGLSNGVDSPGGSFGPGSFRSQTTVTIP